MAQNVREMWGRIAGVFKRDGDLSRSLPSFEVRAGQKEMAETVFQSFIEECIAIVEAGTGTGKTLAYLIPAVYYSLAYKEPVIISTKTINLQEQILYKDIPLLKKTINEHFTAVLAKGWSNYLCPRRFNSLKMSSEHFDLDELKCFRKIDEWQQKTKTGDSSDINFDLLDSVWERVMAEPTACTNRKCQWYSQCYFFADRKRLKNANIIVTNHALLFTHVAAKKNNPQGASSIFPPFKRLVLDEAHHIEETASNFMGDEASSGELYKLLSSLYRPVSKREEAGLLARIRTHSFNPSSENRIRLHLDSYCIPKVANIREIAADLFYQMARLPSFERDSDKVRITPELKKQAGSEIEESIKTLASVISEYKKNLEKLREEGVRESEDLTAELNAAINRLEVFRDSLIKVWAADNESWIYSLEYVRRNVTDIVRFRSYPLSVAEILYEELFHPLKTTVLTSATLSINRNFNYLIGRLGLDKIDSDAMLQKIIESPFDFEKQAVVAIPRDMPMADDKNFLPMVVPHLENLIRNMGGRTFILFTSYGMLEKCGMMLKERFEGSKFSILMQGDFPRHVLLEDFKNTDKSVLLGTDSFWEGVDVPGDDLECVVIMKLPFKVPSDPIIKARTDYMESRNIDSFLGYHVPQAVIKFKQGFGRLIRSKKDRGTIIVLDRRIIEKKYGVVFLKSLPKCRMLKGSFAGIVEFTKEWMKK